ncbi:MAG: prolyl oligopeptidase family serine peptidase [Pseudolabrys sp.]
MIPGGANTRAMRLAAARWAAALLLAMLLAAPAGAEDFAGNGVSAGPHGPPIGPAHRQLWLVPLPGQRLLMHTVLLRPPGDGPFPLAVINHGSTQNSMLRAHFTLWAYHKLAYWFLARGYAVALPIRPGHGATGGPYFEDEGRCDDPHYRKSGLATADSIQAAVDYLSARPFIDQSKVLVVGQSAGGWGGRGGHFKDRADSNCAPDRLVAAAGAFGRTARIPTLWLYVRNDSYFAPALSRRMFDAFHAAGGTGTYHLLPAVGADGHVLINSSDAIALWAPIVERFLARQGLPARAARPFAMRD